MIRIIRLWLLFVVGTLAGRCGTSATGRSAALTTVEVVWSAPTNNWPEALWVYRVVPQEFSAQVISNLMALASFTMRDRTNRIVGEPPFRDKTVLYFRNDSQSRYLGFYPSLGFIDYHDSSAQAQMTEPVEAVPSETDVLPLGLRCLRLAGIDRSQLATKPDSCDLDLYGERGTRGHLDQGTAQEIKETNNRAIFFVRRVDGIPFRGIGLSGGAKIGFGNHGKVIDLRIYWRNLKPYALHECASPVRLMEWIRSGQLPLPTQAGPREKIRKIVIKKAVPRYDGKFGDEPEDFISPIVEMEVGIESDGPSSHFLLQSPIISQRPK